MNKNILNPAWVDAEYGIDFGNQQTFNTGPEPMGWTPTDTVTIFRDYKTREIVVTWKDSLLGIKEQRFQFGMAQEAFDFACKTFTEIVM